MRSDFDASEFLDLFIEEARELIQLLDEAFIGLEQRPDDNTVIQQIFRAAHSLKASAASQGFEQMSQISHAMENLLDLIRNGRLRADAELVDLLLTGVDALKEHLASAINGTEAPDHSELLQPLEAMAESVDTEQTVHACSPVTSNFPAIYAPDEQDSNMLAGATQLRIVLDDRCSMPLARAWLMIQQLQGIGELAHCSPSLNQLSEGNVEVADIQVWIQCEMSAATLADTVRAWPDVADVSVVAAADDGGCDQPPDLRERRVGPPERRQGLPDTRDNPVERRTGAADRRQSSSQATLRVNVEHMDALMHLVGELVINRTRLSSLTQHLKAFRQGDLTQLSESFEQVAAQLGMVVTEIQQRVMQTRMVPVARLFGRFPRLVRDVARREGKQIDLVMEGGETELDRSLIEEMVDPLTHLLRNAVSHGIENATARQATGKPSTGMVRLSARQQQNSVVIEVSDDGRGMSAEDIGKQAVQKGLLTPQQVAAMSERHLLDIIFMSGFSTAEKVSDVSGRGVGMDVVKSNLEQVGGMVDISSNPGHGTAISLHLPLTMAIIQGLLVVSHKVIFALPLPSVVRILRVEADEISRVRGAPVIVVGDETLPLVSLAEVSNFRKFDCHTADRLIAVIVSDGRHQLGLVVDEIISNEELVIQPLGEQLQSVRIVSGAAILGDGRVALIADVPLLMRTVAEHPPVSLRKPLSPQRCAARPRSIREAASDALSGTVRHTNGRTQ